MRFEVFCYALLPLLASLGGLARPGRASWALLVGYLVYQGLKGGHYSLGPFEWLDELPCLLLYFLTGVHLFVRRRQLPHSRSWATWALVLMALTARQGREWVWPLCASYLFIYLGLLKPRPGWRSAMTSLGNLSFGIYLYGFLIQQVLVAHVHPHWGPRRIFLASFTLSVVAGVLSWHLVEKPFLRYKENVNDDQRRHPRPQWRELSARSPGERPGRLRRGAGVDRRGRWLVGSHA